MNPEQAQAQGQEQNPGDVIFAPNPLLLDVKKQAAETMAQKEALARQAEQVQQQQAMAEEQRQQAIIQQQQQALNYTQNFFNYFALRNLEYRSTYFVCKVCIAKTKVHV